MKRTKQIFSSVFAVVVLLGSCVGMVGCKEDDYVPQGEIYTLQEIYDLNEISRLDLWSIIYYSNNMDTGSNEITFFEEFKEGFTPQPLQEMSEQTHAIIKKDMQHKKNQEENQKVKIKEIEITNYGYYNGYYAFRYYKEHKSSFGEYPTVILTISIDDLYLWDTYGADVGYYVWKTKE